MTYDITAQNKDLLLLTLFHQNRNIKHPTPSSEQGYTIFINAAEKFECSPLTFSKIRGIASRYTATSSAYL
jgi:hypothetical protein